MHDFIIQTNEYLEQNIQAFYNTVYVRFRNPGNPDYINYLKNTFADYSNIKLNRAVLELENALQEDLPQVFQQLQLPSLTVCVVPRAKAESNYKANQLLFKSTIRDIVNQLNGFCDGTDYITRHTDTLTTHLRRTRIPERVQYHIPELLPTPAIYRTM